MTFRKVSTGRILSFRKSRSASCLRGQRLARATVAYEIAKAFERQFAENRAALIACSRRGL
jgi:hypothetical protein